MLKMKLRDSAVTSEGLKAIVNFPELTALDLSETKTGDAALESIGKLDQVAGFESMAYDGDRCWFSFIGIVAIEAVEPG